MNTSRAIALVIFASLLLNACASGSGSARSSARSSTAGQSVVTSSPVSTTVAKALTDRAPKPFVAPVDPNAAAEKASAMAQPRSTSRLDPANDDKIFANDHEEVLRLLALHPDLADLCAVETAASWVAPAKDFGTAVLDAQAVVWGRLTAVTTPDGGVTATVTVLRARPGDRVGTSMTVHLGYGVGLGEPQTSLVVTPEPGSPVLTTGDQAILLLRRDGSAWTPVAGGELPVDSGRIDSAARAFQGSMASRVSPFGPTVDGLTPAELFARFAS